MVHPDQVTPPGGLTLVVCYYSQMILGQLRL
jgi:hypothetical protein